jgi:hypothetical protein
MHYVHVAAAWGTRLQQSSPAVGCCPTCWRWHTEYVCVLLPMCSLVVVQPPCMLLEGQPVHRGQGCLQLLVELLLQGLKGGQLRCCIRVLSSQVRQDFGVCA